MTQVKAALFDFDGTIADTEPLYDIFWNRVAEEYHIGIENFASKIKGTIMPNIMEKYFSNYPEEVRQKILDDSKAFEEKIDFPLIPGVMEFIHALKEEGFKLALVTSSEDRKMKRAFEVLSLDGIFDVVITADRITRGKPNPMCYQLAAADLHLRPEECIVFEDAFTGIQAATAAGMRVIGIASTNPAEALKDKVYAVIPDFCGLTVEKFKEWC